MVDLARQLLNIQDKLETDRSSRDKTDGRIEQLEEQLEKYECKGVDQANDLLDVISSELEIKEQAFTDIANSIEEKYDWGS